MFDYEFYQRNIRILGIIALVVGIGAWSLDWFELVYKCPYCRVQRTVIALLGIVMMTGSSDFITKYFVSVIGFFGAGVAMTQHFRGYLRMFKGEFEFHDPIYFDAFILSFFALFIIVAEVWIICLRKNSPTGS